MIKPIEKIELWVEDELYEIAAEVSFVINDYAAYANGMNRPSILFRKVDHDIQFSIDYGSPARIRAGESFVSSATILGEIFDITIMRIV